jgi:tRNA-uridine 2-sulfurtransferase
MIINDLPPSYILVGLSGGVDSAVAAYLLKKAGHKVEAVFMRNWEAEEEDSACSIRQDQADAQAVCEVLKLPLECISFAEQYWQAVFAHFLAEYRAYRTPNPDILCNKEIKFRAFLDYAKLKGADYIATGHYVRRLDQGQYTYLLKARDQNKDQSYFLYALDEAQLKNSIFPLGELEKPVVRAIAKEIGLKNFAKKDSTGICFIGERKFKAFLSDYLPAQKGMIKSETGEILGEHDGLMFYTLGQRQGLQVGGKQGKLHAPWYVAHKDLKHNVLIVVQGEQHPALLSKELNAGKLHWINGCPPLPAKLTAKIRYRQSDQACMVYAQEEDQCQVVFTEAQRAMTPGQSIVFYQDDICLGGGIIEGFRSPYGY